MNIEECAKFANEHRLCFISTMDKDQPRVRLVQLWFADKTGFYFQCGTYKNFYLQMRKHDKVEVCFANESALHNTHGGEPIKVMRVAGKVEFIDDDMELRARCIKETPGIMTALKVTKPDDSRFAVYRVYTGEVYFWDNSQIQKEKNLEKVKF